MRRLLLLTLLTTIGFTAHAAEISGTWVATIQAAVGERNYTYVFEVNGTKLSGTAKSVDGEATIAEGTVDGNAVSFIEKVVIQGREITLQYTGEVVSNDEIRFKRQAVGSTYPPVEFVARRDQAASKTP
jgi:hypothetical protein